MLMYEFMFCKCTYHTHFKTLYFVTIKLSKESTPTFNADITKVN